MVGSKENYKFDLGVNQSRSLKDLSNIIEITLVKIVT